jgi:hypothetical protein
MLNKDIQRWNAKIALDPIQRSLTISASILPRMTNCIFSEPINLGTEENPQWAYSKMNCEDDQLQLIQSISEPTRKFYLQQTFTYGEVFFIIFLSVFIIYFICKTIWQTFFKG